MSQQISLKGAERKAFKFTHNDGLWDVLLGCFALMFVIAPYLSTSLGDFWSSAVFLPFWALVYLTIGMVRKHVVKPRLGAVRFGPARKARLAKFTVVMLAVNIMSLILGFIAAWKIGSVPGQMFSIIFGLGLLMGFSLAAYFLDFSRLYVYGLLLGLSPLVGEWLWSRGYAAHHGFPLTFGVSAGIMILVGLVLFVRLLRDNPVPVEETPSEGA